MAGLTPEPFHILALLVLQPERIAEIESSAMGPFAVRVCEWPDDDRCDALIVADDDPAAALVLVTERARDTAVIVIAAGLEPVATVEWLHRGAQDVLTHHELASASLPLRLRAAIERQRRERDARTAYATDLETGLPHEQQLIEHMSQLIALREREPAPMALLLLRIEGLATTQARHGVEAANVLRRKVGVRLRAGVRASDVVASLSDDSFAVLLASMLAPADADRVGAKLLAALNVPVKISGQDIAVATALGIAQYPQDGTQPEALLRRAVGLAASAQAQGRAGLSNFQEAGGQSPGAANDE